MNITLRDLQSSEKEYFFSWIRDKDITRYSLSIFQNMKSNDEISIWFDTLLLDKSTYNKAIVDSINEKLIGYAGIANITLWGVIIGVCRCCTNVNFYVINYIL